MEENVTIIFKKVNYVISTFDSIRLLLKNEAVVTPSILIKKHNVNFRWYTILCHFILSSYSFSSSFFISDISEMQFDLIAWDTLYII